MVREVGHKRKTFGAWAREWGKHRTTDAGHRTDQPNNFRNLRRFVQWVWDICLRDHDQDWLNYQEEIGRRHTPVKKNKTDNGHTPPVVPLRYLIGFSSVVITSVRSFLISSGRNEEDLLRMQDAWARGVLLSITLWARAYSSPELW
jgi:hypothetical protein